MGALGMGAAGWLGTVAVWVGWVLAFSALGRRVRYLWRGRLFGVGVVCLWIGLALVWVESMRGGA